MGELVDQLGNKVPGQLVKSVDWNALVVAVEQLGETLGQRIDELAAQLELLSGEVAGVAGRVTTLEGSVAILRQQYRVTLATNRLQYALGEVAEITAQLTDIEGNP
ncbi:MAG: hypothetical protein ACRDIB_05585, partial [Ardenticatenaceae bacterium]